MQPTVSIIIPVFNRANLITKTLDSVLAQTYTNWECLIIDDGSTDHTAQVVQAYIDKDSRFKYVLRSDKHLPGGNGARNYGLKISRGTYVNFLDSDDVLLPEKLEHQLALLESHNANYCICQTEWIDVTKNLSLGLRSKSISSFNRFEDYICYQIFWSTGAPLWKKEFIMTHKLQFDETLKQSQEYDFHIKALAIDDNYIPTAKVLIQLIKHEGNLSNNWTASSEKVISNVSVKANTLKNYNSVLSKKCQLKLLEMVTLVYKDQLLLKNYRCAKNVQKMLLEMLTHMPVPSSKKTLFYIKTYVIYWSYIIFGKGYKLLKPMYVGKLV